MCFGSSTLTCACATSLTQTACSCSHHDLVSYTFWRAWFGEDPSNESYSGSGVPVVDAGGNSHVGHEVILKVLRVITWEKSTSRAMADIAAAVKYVITIINIRNDDSVVLKWCPSLIRRGYTFSWYKRSNIFRKRLFDHLFCCNDWQHLLLSPIGLPGTSMFISHLEGRDR